MALFSNLHEATPREKERSKKLGNLKWRKIFNIRRFLLNKVESENYLEKFPDFHEAPSERENTRKVSKIWKNHKKLQIPRPFLLRMFFKKFSNSNKVQIFSFENCQLSTKRIPSPSSLGRMSEKIRKLGKKKFSIFRRFLSKIFRKIRKWLKYFSDTHEAPFERLNVLRASKIQKNDEVSSFFLQKLSVFYKAHPHLPR